MQINSFPTGLKRLKLQPGISVILSGILGINLAQWVYTYIKIQPQTDLIPLHYTIAFGIDRIGPWTSAFFLPVSGSAILVANLVVSTSIVERQQASATLLLLITGFIELTLLAAALLIFRQL